MTLKADWLLGRSFVVDPNPDNLPPFTVLSVDGERVRVKVQGNPGTQDIFADLFESAYLEGVFIEADLQSAARAELAQKLDKK